METDALRRAIRSLKDHETRRRPYSIALLLLGVVVFAFGMFTEDKSNRDIANALEAFHESPAVAIPAVSAATSSRTIGRLVTSLGAGLIALGAVRFFKADSRAMVLLALVDKFEGPEAQRDAGSDGA